MKYHETSRNAFKTDLDGIFIIGLSSYPKIPIRDGAEICRKLEDLSKDLIIQLATNKEAAKEIILFLADCCEHFGRQVGVYHN